jgi:hypothetical protein
MMIHFWEPATMAKEPPDGKQQADYTIKSCSELLDIFPPRSVKLEPEVGLIIQND